MIIDQDFQFFQDKDGFDSKFYYHLFTFNTPKDGSRSLRYGTRQQNVTDNDVKRATLLAQQLFPIFPSVNAIPNLTNVSFIGHMSIREIHNGNVGGLKIHGCSN